MGDTVERTHFMLEGDMQAMTHADIDNIENVHVDGGGSGSGAGGTITDEDIDEMLSDGDLSDNEIGTTKPDDIPEDYEGDITDDEINGLLDS